ncbi:glycoside hydrolase family 3 N-terminal domain-containing protein [Halomarina oriensis]|uniref:beta-glucosidase n=1 Tax=Halomarina oriensis TaxID=671145 RepID=A0A6B0GJ76_9EURY|nr:glycoside hydrolase family 3 N-terminal domain-containing protein [Halomarina oriensis]MWG33489.1 glycosyl hydrolase [Halomarina oriensis]
MGSTPPGERPSPTVSAVDIDDLLDEMTLDEKLGQLVGTYVGKMGEEKTVEDATSEIVDDHVGAVSPFGIGISTRDDPTVAAETANRLQRVAVEETRLGIPLLVPVDAVHGHAYIDGATVFPHNLGMAATRNPDLVERGGAVTGAETAATGASLNYGPTADVARDQRWGRVFETYGESSYLCGELAAAEARGLRGDDDDPTLGVTAKHFPAYGQPSRGEDASVVDVSESTFRRTFLPQFERLLDEGVDVVMPCYNALDGEPVHGSERFLTGLLREECGFDGVVTSDWGGVDHLHQYHRTAADRTMAARQSFTAGLDLVSVGGPAYAVELRELVDAEELSERRVDESVRRVLELKATLGLFEDPYVDESAVSDTLAADEHREAALDAARESMTLLKNDDVLPLDESSEVLVTGPNADDLHHQFGGWSVMDDSDLTGITIREGIADVVGEERVSYEPGAGVTEERDVAAAASAAEDADAAVVVLGEDWYLHEFGPQAMNRPTGEFPTRTELDLPDAQRTLLEAVQATGTPTVLVLVSGRPLSIPWAAEHVPGILMAYYPGMDGGTAVAETLFGRHDPSGRLPISVPRSTGHLPTRFDYLRHPTPIGADEHPDSYDPLFAFGHGLSYTEFEVRAFSLSQSSVGPAGTVTAEVTVENVGDRDGERSVDLFVEDVVSSRVTPARQHVGVARATLAAGESTTLSTTVPVERLAVHGRDYERVEPGEFVFHCEGETAELTVTRGRE